MRGIWIQASRPRPRAAQSSTFDTLTSSLVRQSTSRLPKRRPSFYEHVFTVLLTPVLAAALFVDTSWKAKQRRDWDDRLTVINEEIDQLKAREHQLRNSFLIRNIHNGLYGQRRGYASAAYAVAGVEDEDFAMDLEVPSLGDDISGQANTAEHARVRIPEEVSRKQFSSEEMSNFERYHRLNAIELALRMLLHLRMGANAFYTMTPPADPVDVAALEALDIPAKASFPSDTDRLVQMLAVTRKQMQPLRNVKDLCYAAPQIQARANRGPLHQNIQSLTADFDAGNISLPELVDGFGKAILQSKDVPSISAYVLLIRSLSKVGSHSLAYHATAALKNSTLPLSDPAIFYMLLQIGKARDSRSLNALIHSIANTDNPLGLIHTWQKTRVNGLDLPVPATLNPRLLTVLIYVALRCEQPDRAEAWLSLLREADYGIKWKDDVFRSFLAFYSEHGNWEQGKQWLQRSVNHALSLADQSIDRLARVIYRMLDLCVRCRKLADYTTILDAAVESGIGPPVVVSSHNEKRRFHPRTRSILLEWEALPLPDRSIDCPPEAKAKSFQNACKSMIEELSGQSRSTENQADDGIDVGLVPRSSNDFHSSQRYAVRNSDQTIARSAKELDQLKDTVARQESLISEMEAKFALTVQRRKSIEGKVSARAKRLVERTMEMGNRLAQQEAFISKMKAFVALTVQRQESVEKKASTRVMQLVDRTEEMGAEVRNALAQLKVSREENEATLRNSRLKAAVTTHRNDTQIKQAQQSSNTTAQLARDSQELKVSLQTSNANSWGERATTRNTTGQLKSDARSPGGKNGQLSKPAEVRRPTSSRLPTTDTPQKLEIQFYHPTRTPLRFSDPGTLVRRVPGRENLKQDTAQVFENGSTTQTPLPDSKAEPSPDLPSVVELETIPDAPRSSMDSQKPRKSMQANLKIRVQKQQGKETPSSSEQANNNGSTPRTPHSSRKAEPSPEISTISDIFRPFAKSQEPGKSTKTIPKISVQKQQSEETPSRSEQANPLTLPPPRPSITLPSNPYHRFDSLDDYDLQPSPVSSTKEGDSNSASDSNSDVPISHVWWHRGIVLRGREDYPGIRTVAPPSQRGKEA